jgi:hypothetical protein
MSALRTEGILGNMAKRLAPSDVAGQEPTWVSLVELPETGVRLPI